MRTIKREIVGAFIFSNDGHILLGKNGAHGVYRDMWAIPGGGIEDGETKLEAVAREVMEEVAIDISGAVVTPFNEILTGQSEKTLKETGERVIVDMNFNDFMIEIDAPAAEIPFSLDDDLSEAVWTLVSELPNLPLTPGVDSRLRLEGIL